MSSSVRQYPTHESRLIKKLERRIAELEEQLKVRGEQMESMRSVLNVNWLLDSPIRNWFDINGKVKEIDNDSN